MKQAKTATELTPFQKMDLLFRKVVSVPKSAIDKEQQKYKTEKKKPVKKG